MIKLTNEQGQTLVRVRELLNGIPLSGPAADLAFICGIVAEQLNAPDHFDDLVDTVAKIVQDPRVSKIQGSNLEALRLSILSPRELSKLKSLNLAGTHCHGCSGEFRSYELATMVDGMAYCHRCAYPELVSCAKCQDVIDLTGVRRTIERALERHVCPAVAPPPPSPTSAPRPSAAASVTGWSVRREAPAQISYIDEPIEIDPPEDLEDEE